MAHAAIYHAQQITNNSIIAQALAVRGQQAFQSLKASLTNDGSSGQGQMENSLPGQGIQTKISGNHGWKAKEERY